jgi:hypothetical protein
MAFSRKSVTTINVTDDKLSRIQVNLATPIGELLAAPVSDGVLASAVVPASGPARVPHQLGRRAQGFFLAYASAVHAGIFYAVPAEQDSPESILALQCPGTLAGTNLTFWVF